MIKERLDLDINTRLKQRVGQLETFKLMEQAAREGISAVELMQETFTDILLGLKGDELRYKKMYIGRLILSVMVNNGYMKDQPIVDTKTQGIFTKGASYKKIGGVIK